MRKLILILCIIAMLVTFNACSPDQKNEADSTISVVTTQMDSKDSMESDESHPTTEGEDSSLPDKNDLVVEEEVEIVLEEGQEVTGF